LGLHPFNPPQEFHRWAQGLGCSVNPYTMRWEFDKTAARTKHLQHLHDAIAPFSVRLRCDDIEGFPESEIVPTLVDLLARDTEEIQRLYREMRDVVRNLDAVTAEVELLRRRQRAEFLKVGIFADMVEAGIDEGKSVVTFLCFRDTLFALKALLQERGITSVDIRGDQPVGQRDAGLKQFQDNQVFSLIAMVQCGGVSLNMHDLRGRPRLSLISPDWNAIYVKQCLGRIHRAGALSKAVQRLVFAANTVEVDVYRSVLRKMGNTKVINDGDVADVIADGFSTITQGG
jgi:superfamily II DNA or RNA helicase